MLINIISLFVSPFNYNEIEQVITVVVWQWQTLLSCCFYTLPWHFYVSMSSGGLAFSEKKIVPRTIFTRRKDRVFFQISFYTIWNSMRIIFRNDPTVTAKTGCAQQIKCLDILRVRELIIFHSTRKLFSSHIYTLNGSANEIYSTNNYNKSVNLASTCLLFTCTFIIYIIHYIIFLVCYII